MTGSSAALVYEGLQQIAEKTPVLMDTIADLVTRMASGPQPAGQGFKASQQLKAEIVPLLLDFRKTVVDLGRQAEWAKVEHETAEKVNAIMKARAQLAEANLAAEVQLRYRVFYWTAALFIAPTSAYVLMRTIGL